MKILCKKCEIDHVIKNGKARNLQRYKCKECNYSFVIGDRRERTPQAVKALAILLYSMSRSSYSFLAKLFKVSPTEVYNWIRNYAESIGEPIVSEGDYDIEFDEMWHFVGSKKQALALESSGSSHAKNHCLGATFKFEVRHEIDFCKLRMS